MGIPIRGLIFGGVCGLVCAVASFGSVVSASFTVPQQPAASSPATAVPPKTVPQNPIPPAVAQPNSGFVVILDPGHGGADTGARGENGVIEKDVVLQFAREARAELERQGYRVILTRNDDSDPSYDDRDGIANAHVFALFISLHVSSTGPMGTARAYYYHFGTPLSPPPVENAPGSAAPAHPVNESSGLLKWNEAQRPFEDASHRFADMLQAHLAQTFSGSPALSSGVEERELRSVTGPAVAVEVSSVSVADPNTLLAMGVPLADAIVKSVTAFRGGNLAGTK